MTTENDKQRILIVDDESDITTALKIYLEIQGFHVDAFTDPVYALAQFKVAIENRLLYYGPSYSTSTIVCTKAGIMQFCTQIDDVMDGLRRTLAISWDAFELVNYGNVSFQKSSCISHSQKTLVFKT